MAESMAYNRNSLGDLGEVLDVTTWPDDLKQYIHFYTEQNQHYRKVHNVTDVAVLRSFPSTAYNSGSPQLQTTLMEQVLIQYKIPFDIISDRDLTNLSRYRTVILADQESLTSQAVQQISDYVRNGGGLVATGSTSLFTEWHRRRNDFALGDVFHVHVDGSKFSFGSGGGMGRENLLTDVPEYKESTFGKGRVVYLKAVVPVGKTADSADIAPINAGYTHNQWSLPGNTADLIKAVTYTNGARFSVEFGKAPLTTTMELTDNQDKTERVLHWINYQLETPVVAAVPVSVAVPAQKHVASIEVISPDGPAQTVKFHEEDGRVSFTLPQLVVYNAAVIHLQ